jgi:hypothetical protein
MVVFAHFTDVSYRGDEAVTATVGRLDEPRRARVVVEHAPKLADAHLQDAVADEHVRPQRVEQFPLGHQPAGPRREVAKDRERFGRQRHDARRASQVVGRRIEFVITECELLVFHEPYGRKTGPGQLTAPTDQLIGGIP